MSHCCVLHFCMIFARNWQKMAAHICCTKIGRHVYSIKAPNFPIWVQHSSIPYGLNTKDLLVWHICFYFYTNPILLLLLRKWQENQEFKTCSSLVFKRHWTIWKTRLKSFCSKTLLKCYLLPIKNTTMYRAGYTCNFFWVLLRRWYRTFICMYINLDFLHIWAMIRKTQNSTTIPSVST